MRDDFDRPSVGWDVRILKHAAWSENISPIWRSKKATCQCFVTKRAKVGLTDGKTIAQIDAAHVVVLDNLFRCA